LFRTTLFDDDDDDTDQHSLQEQLSEPTSDTSADEDEVVHEQVQLSLSNCQSSDLGKKCNLTKIDMG
jgi:hypothetical protein